MNAFFHGVRETIAPRAGSRHGPLPPLLLGLTVVTGFVDAFSYLVLGHVFVANMTGNVVFLAFALAGAKGFLIGASAVALVSFGIGALAVGRAAVRLGQDRAHLLGAVVACQAALVAIAMGTQNATVRRRGEPDLQTTNVLTTAITAMAADSAMAAGSRSSAGRRSLSVVALFIGALIGAAFVVDVAMLLPLIVALVALTTIAAAIRLLGRANPAWVRP